MAEHASEPDVPSQRRSRAQGRRVPGGQGLEVQEGCSRVEGLANEKACRQNSMVPSRNVGCLGVSGMQGKWQAVVGSWSEFPEDLTAWAFPGSTWDPGKGLRRCPVIGGQV